MRGHCVSARLVLDAHARAELSLGHAARAVVVKCLKERERVAPVLREGLDPREAHAQVDLHHTHRQQSRLPQTEESTYALECSGECGG